MRSRLTCLAPAPLEWLHQSAVIIKYDKYIFDQLTRSVDNGTICTLYASSVPQSQDTLHSAHSFAHGPNLRRLAREQMPFAKRSRAQRSQS
jgi:hypothetical protein